VDAHVDQVIEVRERSPPVPTAVDSVDSFEHQP
jgi:hypothetical protein